MPSPRPVRPSPSVVVPDTLTAAPASASLSTFSASARRGASRGRFPMTWTATLPTTNPAAVTSRNVSRRGASPDAPAHSGRDVPKFPPRSPRPAAESSASHIACDATSPSEWPSRPASPGQCKPARYSSRELVSGCTSTPVPTRGTLYSPGGTTPPNPLEDTGLGGKNLVEESLGLVLVGLLGQGQLAHQDLARLGEHALLARGQAALPVPPPQVTNDLGDLVHVTGRELLQVGLVTPGPVSRLFRMRRAEHLEHPLKPFGAYDVPNAYQLGIVRGDTHGQVTLVDLEDQIGLILAFYGASLDRFDASSPVMGIDDGIADLERHVASTPSAEDHLTTSDGADKTPWGVNVQVSTVIEDPYLHRSAGRADAGTTLRGLTSSVLVYPSQ